VGIDVHPDETKGTSMRAPPFLPRALMAGIFLNGGINTFSAAEKKTGPAEKLGLPNPEQMVRFDSAAKVAGAAAMTLGILPRLAATGLSISLIPTTLGAHRFWELEDPQQRATQLTQFLKNAGLLGGLLLIALWPDGDACD
jgi:putative oxidoreductase